MVSFSMDADLGLVVAIRGQRFISPRALAVHARFLEYSVILMVFFWSVKGFWISAFRVFCFKLIMSMIFARV